MDEDKLRAALREIERMAADGTPLERWVEQLVVELRAALPEQPGGEPDLAGLIAADPQASLVAQAQISPAVREALKGLIVASPR